MFTQQEFAVFEVEGFDARMPLLRERITPRLKEMAQLLAPRIESELNLPLYPHVAMHMRRTVNPPEETWAAFARSPRAYKPYIHFRLAINRAGIKFSCFVEDDADDKPAFADGLIRNEAGLAAYLKRHRQIFSVDLTDAAGRPTRGDRLTAGELSQFGRRLQKVKAQHASFVIPLGRENPAVADERKLADAAIDAFALLLPIYRLGAEPGFTLAS